MGERRKDYAHRSTDEVGVRTKLAVFLKRKFSFLIELVFVEEQVLMLGRSSLFGLYNLLPDSRASAFIICSDAIKNG